MVLVMIGMGMVVNGRAATTSAEVDVSRFIWDKSQENESKINQVINSKWDATKQAVVAENVYGKLGAFVQLKANQIIVGDSGEKIDDSLIDSASSWNGKTTLLTGSGVYTGLVKATQIIVGDANEKISDSVISSALSWNEKTTLLTGDGIYTGTVEATQISAETLSAISANLGSITAGSISSVSIYSSTITGSTIQTQSERVISKNCFEYDG